MLWNAHSLTQQVLGDEGKRRDYDSFGMRGGGAAGAGTGGFQSARGFNQTGTKLNRLTVKPALATLSVCQTPVPRSSGLKLCMIEKSKTDLTASFLKEKKKGAHSAQKKKKKFLVAHDKSFFFFQSFIFSKQQTAMLPEVTTIALSMIFM